MWTRAFYRPLAPGEALRRLGVANILGTVPPYRTTHIGSLAGGGTRSGIFLAFA